MKLPIALTLAGSDPSGGAGIQADLKTFHQFECYGMAVISLITVQSTRELKKVQVLEPQLVQEQLETLLSDIPPAAMKTGALGNSDIIRAVAKTLRSFKIPLVVDPVMLSKQGAELLDKPGVPTLAKELFPLATLVTPNLEEAAHLSGFAVSDVSTMKMACKKIQELGPQAVLVKGGHLKDEAIDVLLSDNQFFVFSEKRISSTHTHGTGCTLSAAITAELANGKPLVDAVQSAKLYVTKAITNAPPFGTGIGPLNHHVTSRLDS